MMGLSDTDTKEYIKNRFFNDYHLKLKKFDSREKVAHYLRIIEDIIELLDVLRKNPSLNAMITMPLTLDILIKIWMVEEANQYSEYREKDYLDSLLHIGCLKYLQRLNINYAGLRPQDINDYTQIQIQFLEHFSLAQLLSEKLDNKNGCHPSASFEYIHEMSNGGGDKLNLLQFGLMNWLKPVRMNPTNQIAVDGEYEFRHPILRDYFIARFLVDALRKKYQTSQSCHHDFLTAMKYVSCNYLVTDVEQFVKNYIIEPSPETHIISIMKDLLTYYNDKDKSCKQHNIAVKTSDDDNIIDADFFHYYCIKQSKLRIITKIVYHAR